MGSYTKSMLLTALLSK